ncbi:MAG: isocitrate/isopropylmalate family dehydrogenase [Oscillospiraceae bacterium]
MANTPSAAAAWSCPAWRWTSNVTTDPGTRRIARAAFEYARQNGKPRVAIVTKANILKKTDGKFTALCHEVAAVYPEIAADD